MGSHEREELDKQADNIEKATNLRFSRIPKGLYSGMPFTTIREFVKTGATLFSRERVQQLVRDEPIQSHCYRVGRTILLDPIAVRLLRAHEQETGRAGAGGPRFRSAASETAPELERPVGSY